MCDYESSGCVIGVVLECFLLVIPPLFFVFFVDSPPIRERSSLRVSTLQHLGTMSHVDHNLESPPSFSSLVLLDFILKSKNPHQK